MRATEPTLYILFEGGPRGRAHVAEPEAAARLRPRAMATFQALGDRLAHLVPHGCDPSAIDQAAVFDTLAEAQLCLKRTDPEDVRARQRGFEDALLRITCGGWAGPAVRRSASDVLSVLFSVGASPARHARRAAPETDPTLPSTRKTPRRPNNRG